MVDFENRIADDPVVTQDVLAARSEPGGQQQETEDELGPGNDIASTVEVVQIGSEDVVAEDEPDAGAADSNRKPLAVVRVESAERFRGAVLLSTAYGIVGDHRWAIDPEGIRADADLRRLATTRVYRALVIAPPAGACGFLAVEVISRSHAAGRLPSRLRQGAKDHVFKMRTFGAVADDESVKELMTGARIPEVRLFQTVPDADSVGSTTVPATLTFKIGKGSAEEESLRERLMPWLPTKKNKAKKEKPDPRAEANSLVSWLWPAIADDANFDTAEVVVQGRNRTKRLKPLDMTEGFTYDLGDVRPSDDNFIKSVRDVVDLISATNTLNLEHDWASPVAK
ncbi:hypothetical protein [Pseudarthrobacter scleromae]|uniref:hypothetical protein n=1 Tax=Pseudarthrobacter scleromae TaxID=158897 RepID=UPI003D08915C